MNSNDGALDFEVLMNNDKFKASMDESIRRIQGLSKTTVTEGKKMDGAFNQIGDVVSGLIGPVSAMAAAYKFQQLATEALEFERAFGMAMREVQTISKAVQEDMEGISEAIVDMSANGPDGAVKLAKAYYQIVSAGYDGAAGLKLLEISAMAATAGVTETAVAADGLTTVLNAWGLSADKAEGVADVMFKTVERGKTKFEELASSIAQVAPLAAANGISLEEIFAALQTITKQGIPTAQAVTQIRSAIINMTKVLGDGWSNTMTFQEGLETIAKKAGGSQTALRALIPDVEAIGGILAMSGEKAKGAAEDLDATTKATGSARKAYGAMMEEADNKWSMVHNKWTREVRLLGTAMKEESSNMASFMDALLSSGADADPKFNIRGIADRIKAQQIMGGSMLSSYLLAPLMPDAGVQEGYDKFVKTLTDYAKQGLNKQELSFSDILGIEDKDDKLLKLTEFLTTLRAAEEDLGATQFENNEQQRAALLIRANLWGEVETKARAAIKALEGKGSAGSGNGRTLKIINEEIAAAKELQEATADKAGYDGIQQTINKLEEEKASIVGVKKAVDELKTAQQDLEAAAKSGDEAAMARAAKTLTALETEKQKLEEIIELQMKKAWNSQFEGQSMEEIQTIGPKPVTQGGPKGTEKFKLEFGKLKAWVKGEEETAAKEQEDLDQETLDKKMRAWQNVLAATQQVTGEMVEQGYLSEGQAELLNATLNAIATGNPTQLAATLIANIIATFPETAAARYAQQIEAINEALRDQQRLIDKAGRTGGESSERKKELELLKQRKAADEAELARYEKKEKKKFFSVFDFGFNDKKNYAEIDRLTLAIKDNENAIDDAEQALDDFLVGGITQNTIADAIGQGFLDGKTSVDDFADYLNDVLLNAVTDIFKNQYLLPDINKYLTPLITQALDDNVISPEEKKGIDEMSKWIADKNGAIWDGLTGSLDLGGEGSSVAQSSVKGISASASEDTLSAMVGQTMALRNDFKISQDLHRVQVEQGLNQTAILTDSLFQLQGIKKNTDNLGRLENIERGIDTINDTLKKGLSV